jgi:phosphoglycerol transferase MdoB-like AlkP superfamily enzyme
MHKILCKRQGGVILFYILFLLISTLTRIVLTIQSWGDVDKNPLRLMIVFLWGFLFDLAAASFLSIPIIFYLLLLPQSWFRHSIHKSICAVFYFVSIYLLIFGAISEWFFWKEFGTRFNFIAVDYLVYTHEVIGNIQQSYPVTLLITGIFISSVFLFYALWKINWLQLWSQSSDSRGSNWILATALLMLPLFFFLTLNNRQVPQFSNIYNQELAKNGLFSLVAEFRNNELPYKQFYLTIPVDEAFNRLHRNLQTDRAEFLSQDPFDITRLIKNTGEEKRYNVIQITVESLNADYLGVFDNPDHLTPNLDALAGEGMLFTNLLATGNRTVRGMEALSLSFPPTPGQSIVKREHNEHLFTLGSVFRSRGYDTAFIYGGFGYFDNMNYFFGENGYKVIDRNSVSPDQITFSNIWGACDGDVFNWVMKEADDSYSNGKPFYHFVMTTSNHRPYTYPDDKIDIASHTGRAGAVKYTDYAIGEFLRQAATKPWFSNTIFLIVADHCASSAGKTDLPLNQYHIPCIIYNPNLIPPQKVTKLCSQIDVPPTILGLLNWTYESRFYGTDILKMQAKDERALIATYQKLGYLKNDSLEILQPVRSERIYQCNLLTGSTLGIQTNEEMQKDCISYYQTASYLFTHQLQSELPLLAKEHSTR